MARFGKSVVKVRSSLAKISVYLISNRKLDELHELDELFLCFYEVFEIITHVTHDRNADDADNADFHGFFVPNVLQSL